MLDIGAGTGRTPTGWCANRTSGLDVFDVEREACPIEMRWLVYQKLAARPQA